MVLRSELVSRPQFHEPRRRRDDHGTTSNHPHGTIAREMNEGIVPEASLDTVTGCIQLHRVDVDGPIVRSQLHTDRPPILDDLVATTEQPLDEAIDLRRVDEDVQITVRSGLGSKKGINSPAAVHLVDDSPLVKPVDDADDLVGVHTSERHATCSGVIDAICSPARSSARSSS